MSLFATGHIPDHPAVVARRRSIALHPARKAITEQASSLPLFTTNGLKLPASAGGPGILNQHDVGGCEGCRRAGTATLRLAIKGSSPGLLSNVQAYRGALMFDAQVASNGTIAPIADNGTMPSSIDQAVMTFGMRLASTDPLYPMQSSTLYVNPSANEGDLDYQLIKPASIEDLYADQVVRFDGVYYLSTASGSPTRLLQMLSTLAAGIPVGWSLAASGSQFQSYTGGVLGTLSGPIDHANYCCDYLWTGSAGDWATFTTALQQNNVSVMNSLKSGLQFVGVNSWDVTWGISYPIGSVVVVPGGTYRTNTDFIDQAQDLSADEVNLIQTTA